MDGSADKRRPTQHWEIEVPVVHEGDNRDYLGNRNETDEKQDVPEEDIAPASIEKTPEDNQGRAYEDGQCHVEINRGFDLDIIKRAQPRRPDNLPQVSDEHS